MARIQPLSIDETSGYSSSISSQYELIKLYNHAIDTNANILPYWNRSSFITIEKGLNSIAGTHGKTNKTKVPKKDPNINPDNTNDNPDIQKEGNRKDSVPKGIHGVTNFISSAVNSDAVKQGLTTAKLMTSKVSDFTKSSIAKIDSLPENVKRKKIDEIINNVKDNPVSLHEIISQGIKSAGKGIAIAGLSMVCLPAAVMAIVADNKTNASLKKQSVEKLKQEIIKINVQIQKAENEADYDKKADLLIAKQVTEQAYRKLKYSIRV